MNNNKITVNNIQISVVQTNATDYICISDIAKAKEGNSSSKDIIKNWIRNRKTLEFIGTWEILYNANFNRVEYSPPPGRGSVTAVRRFFTVTAAGFGEKMYCP